jgi:hypothetical protein
MQETKSTIRFSAKLLRPKVTGPSSAGISGSRGEIGSQARLTLPRNASAKLPSRDVTMVEGILNGFPFRAALEPDGKGNHWLRINKALQGAARADTGDTVAVEITRVGEEPEIRVPADLLKALAAAPPAKDLWLEITPMARREWIRWVTSAKQEETRRHRIETACDLLTKGKRRPCCFPGINWVTKDSDVKSDEIWLPLPGSMNHSSPDATR